MAITKTKKEFLKKISGGIHVLMATSFITDEIAVNQEDEIEKLIAESLLEYNESAIGEERAWFSEQKFHAFIDRESSKNIARFLQYMDDRDLCLRSVFNEACMHPDDFTGNEKKFAEMIRNKQLLTFFSFVDL